MAEVEVGGHTYRLGKLDARKQLHVFRRLSPLIASAGGIASLVAARASMVRPEGEGPSLEQMGAIAGMIGPVLNVLASLPDDEVDYVIDTCLQVVSRKNEGDTGWSPVCPQGVLMFDDISLPSLLDLTARVVVGEAGSGGLGDFFNARPPS